MKKIDQTDLFGAPPNPPPVVSSSPVTFNNSRRTCSACAGVLGWPGQSSIPRSPNLRRFVMPSRQVPASPSPQKESISTSCFGNFVNCGSASKCGQYLCWLYSRKVINNGWPVEAFRLSSIPTEFSQSAAVGPPSHRVALCVNVTLLVSASLPVKRISISMSTLCEVFPHKQFGDELDTTLLPALRVTGGGEGAGLTSAVIQY